MNGSANDRKVDAGGALPTDHAMDATLRSIACLDWPGSDRNGRIEEFLMNQTAARPAKRGRPGVWLGVGVVLLGGAVFGSVRLYQSYMVHLTVNGQEQLHQVEAGPDGNALIEVPMEGGGTARILVGPENVGEDGLIHASIRVEQSGGAAPDQSQPVQAIGPASIQPDKSPDPSKVEPKKESPKKPESKEGKPQDPKR